VRDECHEPEHIHGKSYRQADVQAPRCVETKGFHVTWHGGLTDPSSPAWTRTRTIVALATRRVAGPRPVQRGVRQRLCHIWVRRFARQRNNAGQQRAWPTYRWTRNGDATESRAPRGESKAAAAGTDYCIAARQPIEAARLRANNGGKFLEFLENRTGRSGRNREATPARRLRVSGLNGLNGTDGRSTSWGSASPHKGTLGT